MPSSNGRKRRPNTRSALRAQKKRNRVLASISACVLLAVLIALGIDRLYGARGLRAATGAPKDEVVALFTLTPTVAATPTPEPSPEPTPDPTPDPTPSPTPYVYHTAGRKLNPDKKMVAFTFDDGPSASVTPKILKALKKNKAKATFFMLGERAEANASVAKSVAEAGHQIGTHTYGHKSLIRLEPDAMTAEIEKSLNAIEKAAGYRPVILRPPYGNVNDSVKETVNMPMINWSVDTLDWDSRNAKSVYKEIMNNVRDGDIILMHDIYDSTAEALSKVLPELSKLGYQFVTIDELFMLRGKQLELGTVYYSCRK